MTDIPKHPMEKHQESDKVRYLSLISKVCVVDGVIKTEESQAIELLSSRLGLSASAKASVMQAAFSTGDWRSDADGLVALNDHEIRFSCISDLAFLAISDAQVTREEMDFINTVGAQLDVSPDKISGIVQIQEKMKHLKQIPPESQQFREMFQDIAATAGSIGVPVAAVCVSGVWGLSAVGITSGLAALGALVGGGMLAGAVAVVPALGIAGWYLGKTVYNVIFRKK